jgi:hypothetical protein
MTSGPNVPDTVSTATREQTWTLESLGNWRATLAKTSGTTDQNRTHNLANETTGITGGS